MKERDAISTQTFKAVTVWAYWGIIMAHIVGKYYVRGTALTADWFIANALDGILRPSSSILEMMAGYYIFQNNKPLTLNLKAILSFYKKRAFEWWLPILAMTEFILLYWGSYDKKTSIGFVSIFMTAGEILTQTPGYPFWLGVVLIGADLFAPICWFLDTKARRKVIQSLMLLWFFLIIVPSVPGLFSGPVTHNLFARDLGFLLFGGYCLVPAVRHIAAHAGQMRWLLSILGISLTLTLSVPLYEHFSGIDPWYHHTLRNYSMPYVALYSFSLAISLFMFFEKHKNWSKTVSKLFYLCFPSYLIHSWIIECGIYWHPSTPILGLVVKVVSIASVILAWAWLWRYIQSDLGNSPITRGEES